MLTKNILAVVATAFVGLTTGVGCGNADQSELDESNETNAQPVDAMIPEVQESGLAPSQISLPKPSPVTCTGDQNNGGRICCDATHCCINILGVINCSLPPRTTQLTRY